MMQSTLQRQKASFYKYASVLCAAVAVIQLLKAFLYGKMEYAYFSLALAGLAAFSVRRAHLLRRSGT